MTNHLESLLKALLVPSERVQVENKKDVDAFVKSFKKKKRLIFMKLNKNQISKIQVNSYYKNLISYLENYKKKRIQNIIALTEEFMEEFHCSTNVSDVGSVDRNSYGKKRPLSGKINNVPKKTKLNAVVEDRILTPDTNDERLCIKMPMEQEKSDTPEPDQSCPVISYTERLTNDMAEEEEDSAATNETFEIVESEAVPVLKTVNNSKADQVVLKEVELSLDKAEQLMSAKLPLPRTVSSAAMHELSSYKKSGLKTPLAKQTGLYKSKFHNDFSSSTQKKTSQTSSVQKKTVAEIRRLQEKQEEQRQQRIKEDLQRKENNAKLASMRSTKNPLLASRVQPNGVPAKPLPTIPKIFPPKTLATNLAKVNSLEKFPLAATSAKPSTLPSRPVPTIGTVAKTQLNSRNPSSNRSAVPDVSYPPEFKTPFAKKRVTMLTMSCRKIIESHESLDLTDLRDVDTEDEDDEFERRSKTPVPNWCRKTGGTLVRLIKYQSNHLDSGTIFRNPALVPIDIETIFGRKGVVQNYLEEWEVL